MLDNLKIIDRNCDGKCKMGKIIPNEQQDSDNGPKRKKKDNIQIWTEV